MYCSTMPLSSGPGPVQRERGDQVLEAVRLHAREQLAHAAAFELEDADRVAARDQAVGRRIVERQRRDVDVACRSSRCTRRTASAISVSVFRPRKSNLISPMASTSGPENCVIDRAVLVDEQRHVLDQRPVGDHDAGGVLGDVAREAFELDRVLEELGLALAASRAARAAWAPSRAPPPAERRVPCLAAG